MATDDKYDRQLRLWGAHGQRALMEARICVLGSTPVATEVLKNLVLPGIGRFTVVDNATVEPADLGTSFFLEENDLGCPRAEAVTRCLVEMNPDVQGDYMVKDALEAVVEGIDFFTPFSLVIACQLTERPATRLCSVCYELGIPLILITSVGFIGRIRICIKEHCVCETKPDSEFGDLRLADPFTELRRYADSITLSDDMDEAEHAHVPYVVILIKALDAFRERSQKQLPSTREEKDDFKRIILEMQRSDKEANFAEAMENAYKAWMPYTIPDPVQELLALETPNTRSDFWVVARAVSQFVRDCGKLPLAGSLPDMTANTESYVRLQEIYGSRAGGDCAAIIAHVAGLQKDLGVTTAIPEEFIKRFCVNAQYCEVFKFRSLEQEFQPCTVEDGGVDLECEIGDDDSLIQWYLALRAVDNFREAQGHWPGELVADSDEVGLNSELATLTSIATRIVESYQVEGVGADPKALEEMVRYGGSELHTTSSILGGVASQEAVKLVAKQYSPLNNTFIWNGLNGKMQTLEV